jgi:hypothetical protein
MNLENVLKNASEISKQNKNCSYRVILGITEKENLEIKNTSILFRISSGIR